jgi:hypothetical protein
MTSLLSLLLITAVGSGPSAPPTEPVAFCDVVRQPALFKDRRITVVARLESDGIHAVVLIDPSCKEGMTIDLSHAADA